MKNKLILIPLLITLLAVSKAFSLDPAIDFLNKFSACSKSYTDNGKKITVILGWMNRECHYTEITAQKTVNCTFDKNQLTEISRELRTKKHIGISDLETGKKYFSDREICRTKNNKFFNDDSENYSESEE